MLESDIIAKLRAGEVGLPPLRVRVEEGWLRPAGEGPDAVVYVEWGEVRERFAVEAKALSTPKALATAVDQARRGARTVAGASPMVVVPYLGNESLETLEREGVSGLDLCGNGLVLVPGRIAVRRSGAPNRYTSSAPIKNIYRRNSSMVARAFLAVPRVARVKDLWAAVRARDAIGAWAGTPMSLGTVSKALDALEQDQIVDRGAEGLRLLQPGKLLDKLAASFEPPPRGEAVGWKLPVPAGDTAAAVSLLSGRFSSDVPAIVTGSRSAVQYAVLQAEDALHVYCPDPGRWLAGLPGAEASRFPDLVVCRAAATPLFFDGRVAPNGTRWASPVQTYLELVAGDKRDRETAEQVKAWILARLGESRP